MKKLLIFVFLFFICVRPAYSQATAKAVLLDAASQAAIWSDMVTTEKFLSPQIEAQSIGVTVYWPVPKEEDPLARPFTRLPKPAYYASGASFAGSLAFLAYKMRHSRHRWMRQTWFLPQCIQIGFNATLAIHNIHLR